ncbi:uncharacterized protein EI90DRAFT_3052126 [Cantharellus anzutake]|uniref:uncharacterized protein n=1 Tax=Cantharellus anzutake TaxID=1750568 RepID=UPI001904AD18|nr:uncharacterized protein EI90DRAFT_3052126 [Cantharellus anzutake]KAF8333465.1 hypothetical protein EI90DRAFT_3052126 [Cantharellus anzutake]
MRMDNCPFDLLALFCDWLWEPRDLASVSSTSRSLCRAATPRLYSSLRFGAKQAAKWRHEASFIHTINRRCDLGEYVRSIDIVMVPLGPSGPDQTFYSMCTRAIEICHNLHSFSSVPLQTNQCATYMVEKLLSLRGPSLSSLRLPSGVVGTLEVLGTCTSLSELHLERPSHVLLSALPTWIDALTSTLRSFSLSDSNVSKELLDDVLSRAPGIITLSIKHCSSIGLTDLLILVSKNLPELESLSVALMNGYMPVGDFDATLTNLRSFSIEIGTTGLTSNGSDKRSMDTQPWTSALRCIKNSPLQSLTLKKSSAPAVLPSEPVPLSILWEDKQPPPLKRLVVWGSNLTLDAVQKICMVFEHLEVLGVHFSGLSTARACNVLNKARNLHTILDNRSRGIRPDIVRALLISTKLRRIYLDREHWEIYSSVQKTNTGELTIVREIRFSVSQR